MRFQPRLVIAVACLFLGGRAGEVQAQGEQDGLVAELKTRWLDQWERAPGGELLRQSHEDASLKPRESHEYVLYMDRGIEIVTEIHDRAGEVIEKNLHLSEGKLFAYEVVRSTKLLADEGSKRMEVNLFWFDQGKVIGWETFSKEVPVEETLDSTKVQAKVQPLPTGMDGWGDRLTAYAYDVARGFRGNAAKHVFGDWDGWLLKDAPPAGSGSPALRPAGWLPADGVSKLPVLGSDSPTGRYAAAWGYDKAPVDWKTLAYEEDRSELGKVSFTSKLAPRPLDKALEGDGNYLWNPVTGEALSGQLGFYHPGERQRFNHDELIMVWAPGETCFVAMTTEKWATESAALGWIKDGRCERTLDVIEPLKEVVTKGVLEAKHPAAKRLPEEKDGYEFSIHRLIIDDDGNFEAKVVGQIPKDSEPGGLYEAVVEGKFIPTAEGKSAVIENSKVKVLPERREEES